MRKSVIAAVLVAGWSAGAAWAQDATWTTIQHEILASNCANCHSAGTSFATQSGLELTEDVAYDELTLELPKNTAARIDGLRRVSTAGGPLGLYQSFLWEKINAPEQEHLYSDHPGYGALMPLGRPVLTNGQLAYIRDWITAGAPETGVVADPLLLNDTTRYVPPAFAPLDPPEAGRGFQLHLGPFNVWSSEHDREFLYYQPYATSQDLYVTQYEIAMRPGSHHFILYNYPVGASVPSPANTYRDLRSSTGVINNQVALQIGNLFPFRMFVGTQTPYVNYHLPPGVALRLPRNQGFDLNSHSVNQSGEVQQGEVYVNIHTAPLSEIQHVADYDNFGNTDITLPPHAITTLSKTFTFSETRHLIQMWSHAHQHMLEFKIEGVGGLHDGELLYQTNDWEHPPLFYYDPPLTFQGGDRVKLTTTWNNWTDDTINFGLLGSDEMQFMFYVYYTGALTPPPPLAGDANGDDTVDALDYAIWRTHYNECGRQFADGDFNADTCVTGADYTLWADNYGLSVGASAVPEPAAGWLLLVGFVSVGGVAAKRRNSSAANQAPSRTD